MLAYARGQGKQPAAAATTATAGSAVISPPPARPSPSFLALATDIAMAEASEHEDGEGESVVVATPTPAKPKPKQQQSQLPRKARLISDRAALNVTFSKRKAGLLKKAHELSVMTGADCLLVIQKFAITGNQMGTNAVYATDPLKAYFGERRAADLFLSQQQMQEEGLNIQELRNNNSITAAELYQSARGTVIASGKGKGSTRVTATPRTVQDTFSVGMSNNIAAGYGSLLGVNRHIGFLVAAPPPPPDAAAEGDNQQQEEQEPQQIVGMDCYAEYKFRVPMKGLVKSTDDSSSATAPPTQAAADGGGDDDDDGDDDDEDGGGGDDAESSAAGGGKKKAGGKGRTSLPLVYVENKRRQDNIWNKRKIGMMRKARELHTLTGANVMLVLFRRNKHEDHLVVYASDVWRQEISQPYYIERVRSLCCNPVVRRGAGDADAILAYSIHDLDTSVREDYRHVGGNNPTVNPPELPAAPDDWYITFHNNKDYLYRTQHNTPATPASNGGGGGEVVVKTGKRGRPRSFTSEDSSKWNPLARRIITDHLPSSFPAPRIIRASASSSSGGNNKRRVRPAAAEEEATAVETTPQAPVAIQKNGKIKVDPDVSIDELYEYLSSLRAAQQPSAPTPAPAAPQPKNVPLVKTTPPRYVPAAAVPPPPPPPPQEPPAKKAKKQQQQPQPPKKEPVVEAVTAKKAQPEIKLVTGMHFRKALGGALHKVPEDPDEIARRNRAKLAASASSSQRMTEHIV